MKRLVIPAGILMCAISTYAQIIDTAKLNTYFKALDSSHKFMGSVAMAKAGVILYTKSFGYSNIEQKRLLNDSTKYRIGSISKTFTAVLILKAVEEGKLTLDQTIQSFFPAIINAQKITIRQLLHHRSGIPNFTDGKHYFEWNTKQLPAPALVDTIAHSGSDFEPGTKFSYSNSNYLLLAIILEKVYQQPFKNILDKKIITPLSLKNTYYATIIRDSQNESHSYTYQGAWERSSETDMSIPMGAGGIASTPSDLLRFANALFGGRLLSTESLLQMTIFEDSYGMGLIPVPFYEHRGFGHNGAIDGFTSTFGYFPDEQVAFAITSNGSNFDKNNIAIALVSAAYSKPFSIPVFSVYSAVPNDLDSCTGIYSSTQFPLKITVKRSNNSLTTQATGQPAIGLEPTAKYRFSAVSIGLVMEFIPGERKMILKQRGQTIVFGKE